MSTGEPSDPTTLDGRPYDVVVWGATGYTGRRTAEHLVRAHGDPGALRWALAEARGPDR